jgi:hypothetical protein
VQKSKTQTKNPLLCHFLSSTKTQQKFAVLYLAAELRDHCAIVRAQHDQPLMTAVGDKHKRAVRTVWGKRERKRGGAKIEKERRRGYEAT